jgi:hypothetical protein
LSENIGIVIVGDEAAETTALLLPTADGMFAINAVDPTGAWVARPNKPAPKAVPIGWGVGVLDELNIGDIPSVGDDVLDDMRPGFVKTEADEAGRDIPIPASDKLK